MSQKGFLDYLKAASEITGNTKNYPAIRVAILADTSTQHLANILKASLFDRHLYAEIYEGDFDSIDQDVFDAKSALYKFKPDVIWLHTSSQSLRKIYYSSSKIESGFGKTTLSRVLSRWEALSKHSGARILQNLFTPPSDRLFGNFSTKVPESFYCEVRKLNIEIMEQSRLFKNVFINDLEYVLSYFGRKEWEDNRYWYNARLFCNPELLPAISENTAEIIANGAGKTKKCVILDLDDTLWGGTIGEDGLSGIKLGDTGIGDAFLDFQRYLKALKNRGVIIAVCSKNNQADALEPFEKLPDMVLKVDDISVFKANWNPKSENISEIVSILNIGPDSVVFIDNSPFERNEVRSRFNEICVPEMPDDPAEFVSFLNNLNLFETISFSEEDRVRGKHYKEEADREISRRSFSDISQFLESLEMKAAFARFDKLNLPRIAQLIQRSNQFNLTTSRYDERLCESFASDSKNYFPVYVKLRDKYGDYGLISAIVMRKKDTTLYIDEWVMSCRVLRRGVEQYCINKILQSAATLGVSRIQGTYKPSPKNELVKNLYAELGFKKISTLESGETSWSLEIPKYEPRKVFIQDQAEQDTDCP